MIISGIEVFFGSEIYSHSRLREDIGIDVADLISSKAGFTNRYLTASGSDIIELARTAAQSPLIREEIRIADFILVVTEYVQKLIPPPSAWILSDSISDTQFVLDLNRGCSGFCEALVLSQSLFSTFGMKRGVIITAENYSKIVRRSNRTLSPIFSDAVAFTFVEGSVSHFFSSNYGFDHQMKDNLFYRGEASELFMNGAGLVSFVKTKVVPSIRKLLDLNGEGVVIDHFFAHQGSKLVIETLNSRLPDNQAKALFLSEEVGNLNASSIPYVMKRVLSGVGTPVSARALFSGFGVGLSFCNVLMDFVYENRQHFPTVNDPDERRVDE